MSNNVCKFVVVFLIALCIVAKITAGAQATVGLSASNMLIDQGQSILFTANIVNDANTPYSYAYNVYAYNTLNSANYLIGNMLFVGNSVTSNSWLWTPPSKLYVGNTMFSANVAVIDVHQNTAANSMSFGYNSALIASPTSTLANSIQGSWIIQTAAATASDNYSAQWIGIGGFVDETLIQTGTESDYYEGGAYYAAWYELLPAPETPISNFPVSPGDLISANIVLVAPNTWNIILIDTTTSNAFTIQVTYNSLNGGPSTQLSSEWVEERPELCSLSCTLADLANFGTAYYGYDNTGIPGTNYANMGFGPQPISMLPGLSEVTMVNTQLGALATPSALTPDGTSFTVLRSILNSPVRFFNLPQQGTGTQNKFISDMVNARAINVTQYETVNGLRIYSLGKQYVNNVSSVPSPCVKYNSSKTYMQGIYNCQVNFTSASSQKQASQEIGAESSSGAFNSLNWAGWASYTIINVSNSEIDNGQYSTLTISPPESGTPPYVYQWYSGTSSSCILDATPFGVSSLTQTVSPASNTVYCVKETDSATINSIVYTATMNVVVYSQLTASAAPMVSNSPIDNGQPTTLTISAPTGGIPPYTYQWFVGSSPSCASDIATFGSSSLTQTTNPTAGNRYYCVKEQDSATTPNVVYTGTNEVVVNNALSPSYTLGPWTAENSLPVSMYGGSCAISNSNIYCTASEGTAFYTAPITNNVIGTWTAANSLTAFMFGGSCAVSNNNIYCALGGSGDSGSNIVDAAPITNNVIGVWTAANSMTADMDAGSCAISNNNIYCVLADVTNVVETASITNNVIGTWTTANSVIGSASTSSCVINNSNIYCSLGVGTTVETAPITNNVIGTWTVANSMAELAYFNSCVVSNNYIYCTLGNSETGVEVAPLIGVGNTTVGTWTDTNPLTGDMNGGSCAVGNNNIYCAVADVSNTVDVAPIFIPLSTSPSTQMVAQSHTGTINGIVLGGTPPYTYQWLATTVGGSSYTAAQANTLLGIGTSSGKAQSPNAIWAVSGVATTGTYGFELQVFDSVEGNGIATNSNIVVYNSIAAPTLALSNTMIDQGQSILFSANILSGQGTPPYSYAYNVYATNSGSVTLIANQLYTGNSATANAWLWTPLTNLYVGNTLFFANVVVTDASLITANSVPKSFGYNSVLTVSGVLEVWQISANSLLSPIVYENSCTSSNGYIYCPGGRTGTDVAVNTVQYAQILGSGALGALQTTNSLTRNDAYNSCTSYNSYIYCPGGWANFLQSNAVQYAQVFGSGALGAWQTTNSLTYNVDLNACAASNGYIYCPGGSLSGGTVSNIVQYAQILGSGASSAWQIATNSLAYNVDENSCTASNGYIYCPGGMLSSSTASNIVQYAQVLNSGALGAWQTTNSLTYNVYYNSCTSFDGYIYCPGGSLSGGTVSNIVQYAQILGSGALGAWQTTNPLTYNVYQNACTSANGYIYCPGGFLNSGSSNIIQYAQAAPYYITISNTPAEQGQYESFNGSVAGGTAPYNVILYVANSIAGGTIVYTTDAVFADTSWAFNGIPIPSNWATNSPLLANVVVMDSATTNGIANSINSAITVNSISVSLSAATSPINSGSTEVLSATVSGGSGVYPTITWTGSTEGTPASIAADCPASESSAGTYKCTITAPATTGLDTYTVSVTDSLGGAVTGTASVTVNQAPTGGAFTGGGGGGGGGGGESSLPSVNAYSSGNQTGYIITNLTKGNSETLNFNNTKTIHITINFITPTMAGMTANNNTYNLTIDNTVKLADPNNYTYYAELTNLSYLPIQHTIALFVYEQSNQPIGISTTTVLPTTSSTTTGGTSSTTMVPRSTIVAASTVQAGATKPLVVNYWTVIIAAASAVALLIIILTYLAWKDTQLERRKKSLEIQQGKYSSTEEAISSKEVQVAKNDQEAK